MKLIITIVKLSTGKKALYPIPLITTKENKAMKIIPNNNKILKMPL